jgi:hypothetical protein
MTILNSPVAALMTDEVCQPTGGMSPEWLEVYTARQFPAVEKPLHRRGVTCFTLTLTTLVM